MTAAELFIKALENEGVQFIFGVPGEENLDLLDALSRSSIRFIVTRHEQGAGFMAATVGRLIGQPGVALSTLGPGATNLVTAAAYAQLGGMPMLMVTGQKPIKKSKQGHFQILNTTDIMRPVTKFTKQIVNGSGVPSAVREAFRSAGEERPGAVHLELPEDVAREEVDAPLFTISKPRRPIAEEKAIHQAVEMIQASSRPLLLIGAGANRKRTSKMLNIFIEKTGIPFFNTQMGKGVINERHPLYLGTAALSANDYIHCAIDRADCIINIGHDVVEKPPFIMHHNGQNVIHINFFSAKVDDVYFPHLEVVGDIANTVWRLSESVKKQDRWDMMYFLRVKELFEQHKNEYEQDERFPLVPQRIVADTRRSIPEDGILTLDNGMYKLWFSRNYKTYYPNTLLLDNALATMGAGIPSAIATKLLFPEKMVACVCGDGGFAMSMQELETAVRLRLHLTIIVLRDNGFGMIAWKQQDMGLPSFGLQFGNPDIVALADSFGAHGHRINAAKEFSSVLADSFKTPGVHVIDVPVDYSENYRVFSQELKKNVCQL